MSLVCADNYLTDLLDSHRNKSSAGPHKFMYKHNKNMYMYIQLKTFIHIKIIYIENIEIIVEVYTVGGDHFSGSLGHEIKISGFSMITSSPFHSVSVKSANMVFYSTVQ